MKKLSETLTELGIAFSFPIEIKDDNGNVTYWEASDGFWYKYEHDDDGNETYFEDSDGYCYNREYDANGNVTYYGDSDGYWHRYEYDSDGKVTYCEDSEGDKNGTPKSSKTCEGKAVEVDGIKYKLKAL
jgi:YD repeat-containing protein